MNRSTYHDRWTSTDMHRNRREGYAFRMTEPVPQIERHQAPAVLAPRRARVWLAGIGRWALDVGRRMSAVARTYARQVAWLAGMAIFTAVLFAALMSVGCSALVPSSSQTPAQQLVVLSNDYNLSLAAVSLGLSTGVLTKQEVAAAQPYFDAVDAALVQARVDAAANTPSLQADLNALNAALSKLAPLLLKASAAVKPATRPVNGPAAAPSQFVGDWNSEYKSVAVLQVIGLKLVP